MSTLMECEQSSSSFLALDGVVKDGEYHRVEALEGGTKVRLQLLHHHGLIPKKPHYKYNFSLICKEGL